MGNVLTGFNVFNDETNVKKYVLWKILDVLLSYMDLKWLIIFVYVTLICAFILFFVNLIFHSLFYVCASELNMRSASLPTQYFIWVLSGYIFDGFS